MKSMTKVTSTMESAINDMTAYKDVKNDMKNTEDHISNIESEVNELNTTKAMKEREVMQTKDRLIKAQRASRAKELSCEQTLDQAQKEYDAM